MPALFDHQMFLAAVETWRETWSVHAFDRNGRWMAASHGHTEKAAIKAAARLRREARAHRARDGAKKKK